MDLRSGHPGTPSAWTKELEFHAKRVRRVVVRFAPASGEFQHAATLYLEPVASTVEGELLFKAQAEEGSATVEIQGHVTPRLVVEHCWSAVCAAGIKVAADRDYKRMRGEFDGYDAEGNSLWDSTLCRKRLNLDDPTSPYAEDDDPGMDPQEKKRLSELAWERREHRKTKGDLTASLNREQEKAVSIHEIQLQLSDGLKRVNRMEVEFAQYIGGKIREDIEESRGEARVDYVTQEMMREGAPRFGLVLEGLAVWLRTGGGKRQDEREVIEWPVEVEAEFLNQLGLEAYGQITADRLACRRRFPGTHEYAQAWFDHLRLLNSASEEHKLKFPTPIARRLKLWAEGAAKTIGIDPRDIPYLTFVEGDETRDEEERAKDDLARAAAEASDEKSPD